RHTPPLPSQLQAVTDGVIVVMSPVSPLVNVNGTLFFPANDGVHGAELWQSNGTAAGTVMIKDINAGPANSYPFDLVNANGTLFFSANDGIHSAEPWVLGPVPPPPHAAFTIPRTLPTTMFSLDRSSIQPTPATSNGTATI